MKNMAKINTLIKTANNYVISQNKFIKNVSLSHVFLIVLSMLMTYFIVKHTLYYSVFVPSVKIEGFDGINKNFILKKDLDVFDDFYVDIYDTLVYSDVKNNFELGRLSRYTIIDEHSKILDIGFGTGHHMGQLSHMHESLNHNNIIGIDTSKSMVKKARLNYPELKNSFKYGNALNGTIFNDNTFTHILCLYFTVYYIKDKYRFFKNCHNWLQGGGVMMLHLVDRDNFDPIVPAGNPLEIINVQNYSDKRITNSKVVFNGFTYNSNFDFKPNKNISTFIEKFIFNNGKTRQNNHTFYIEDHNTIIDIAKQAGFIVKGTIHMHKCGYEKQYLYILEK
jgi:ubiquinone/menaquinone biosynthesis C-methylase UbiE